MWQLILFLAAITPLFAWFNVLIIRSIYATGKGDYLGKQWHFAQFCIWAAIWGFALSLTWRIALVWPAYHWIFFDGLLNVYTFKHINAGRPFFYVGKASGSAIDRKLSKLAKPERWAAVLKFTLLAVTLAAAFLL